MIGRLIDLPLQQNTMASAKLADLVITPDLEGYTSADFVKGLKMIPLGYKAAEAQKAKLEAYSSPESAYAPWKVRHDATLPPAPRHRRDRHRPGAGHRPAAPRSTSSISKPGPLDTKVLGAGPQAHLR